MEGRKIQFGRIAGAGFAMLLMSTPAFAQEGGGVDLVDMFSRALTSVIRIGCVELH